jgi:hydrophobic/amphiphilic exporter-1 (mainly G- bacteria), HAE1 family
MIKTFVNRPAMTIVSVLVFVVLGIVSYSNLIIEETPKIEFPLVTVTTEYGGATPKEVETQIIKKIEDSIAEISEIKKIKSTAYENFGFTIIEFNLNTDVNVKAIEVKDKVEAIINELPSSAKAPVIEKFDPLVKPIINLVLTSNNKLTGRDLYEYADKKLKDKLTVIKGVASVDIIGGQKRQINIVLDGKLMQKYYVSIDEVIREIANKNINIPSGRLERKDNNINVRFIGEFQSIDEIKNMVIVSREGNKFKLSEIAKIEDGVKEATTISRFNGKPSVGLAIKKLSDGDAVSISKNIKKNLSKIRKDLPKSMNLEIATDSTEIIVSDTYSTLINILYGIILTILILYLILGRFSSTIVATLVIPTSIISAIFLMDFSSFTINMMTLLAVATSLGTLIANALVVIENITYKINHGIEPKLAAIKGTKEVTLAVLASAGTNLVVFAPIAFMGGITGQFMKQFGLTVIYLTIFSLLASFTLTPMLCSLLIKPNKLKNPNSKRLKFSNFITYKINKFFDFILKEYKYVFNFILKHKKTTALIILIIFITSIYPLIHIGNEFVSNYDKEEITLNIKAAEGTTLEENESKIKKIENIIKQIPEVKSYLSYIGLDGEENAQVKIKLTKREERKKTDQDIINILIPKVSNIPSIEIDMARGQMEGGDEGDISIDIYGKNYDKMIQLSYKMKEIMRDTGFFRSLRMSYRTPKQEIKFIPDIEKIKHYDLKTFEVGKTLRNSINGNDSNIFKEKGEEYDINIELSNAYKESIEDIKNIKTLSKDGLIPISVLGKVKWAESNPTIKRRDKNKVINLYGYLSKSTSGKVIPILNKKIKKKINFADGFYYKYTGMEEYNKESQEEISKAFIIAAILTYMLLVALLNSFLTPIALATSIITSFIGVIYLLFFMHFSINIGAMMAIIMLVGLTVNNGILMIERTLYYIKEKTMNVKEALWNGTKDKFRTIVMTSLAIILGTLPQVGDPNITKASMGGVIIGGMIASVIFTLIVIPPIFEFLNRKKS